MCKAATALHALHGSEAKRWRQGLRRFFRAAAMAVRDGPHNSAPHLAQPLAVLRAAGDCGLWSSEAFGLLAPMVTQLIMGRASVKLPGWARDWKPLLPRPGDVRSQWRIEEAAEVAWLFAQHSRHRALEGQTAVALSLTLLVQIPNLEKGLIEQADQAVADARLLDFAADSCQLLRKSAELPFFEPWSRPETYPGHERRLETEEFDPHLLPDFARSKQLLFRWRRMRQSEGQGARRRGRMLEVAEPSGRPALAACSALAIFGTYDEALARPAATRLLRAYARQSQLRGWGWQDLRNCLRELRTLRAQASEKV